MDDTSYPTLEMHLVYKKNQVVSNLHSYCHPCLGGV